MTTLPRPSRPSYGPPNTPLPALPVSRSRKGSNSSPATPSGTRPASGASLLSTPATTQRSVSSGLPTPRSSGPPRLSLLPNTPGSSAPSPGPNSARSLRKTSSVGTFPPPTKGSRPSSSGNSPNSSSSSTHRYSDGPKAIPPREGSRNKGRQPNRVTSLRSTSYSNGTSFLNGGEGKSVSLLDLPSLPASRSSSAQDSHLDGDGEESRGRRFSVDENADGKSGKEGKGNVIVSVRVRPDVAATEKDNADLEWMVDGRRSLIAYRGREGGEYSYDNVFGVNDKNGRVYDSSAKRLVRRVMEGYHGTVFAYGMTGTGKTFSMQGTASSPGIIPLAITDIFSFIRESPGREFLLRVSYLEIYNEKINDLLAGPGQSGDEIKLREDSKRGVYATPLKEEIVQSPTQLLRVIAKGDNARRVAGTQFNARSSRSHAVVQIVVESRERAPAGAAESKRSALAPGGVRVSTLSLIDLAGSERAADDKDRQKEGAHINKSLLTLGTVISKLSVDKPGEKGAAVTAKDMKHLPYRDSKLTRLLQPALAGGALISILCTIQIGSAGSVASAQHHTVETLNTLKFASRAKNNIVSHAKKADEAFATAGDAGSRALLDRYRLEIADLKKQLESQNKKEKGEEEKEEKEEKVDKDAQKLREREESQRHEEQMLEMQLARTALKERIEHLNRLILSSKSIGVNHPRSVSQMSNSGRNSVATNGDARSVRSSATMDTPTLTRNSSLGSMRSFRQSNASTTIINEQDGEEEDSFGENGDGQASSAIQVRALQADLADKTRYIATLEKRLLQARRSSHSRVSMSFAQRATMNEDGGVETLLREKDSEIAELRARLDDKERMLSALRSAARRKDTAELTADTAHSSPIDRRSNSSNNSLPLGASAATASAAVRVASPRISSPPARMASPRVSVSPPVLSPEKKQEERKKKRKSVDEMTRLLDEMITERVQSGNGTSIQDRIDSGFSVGNVKNNSSLRRTSVRISEPLPTIT